jgi:hypothetical protein
VTYPGFTPVGNATLVVANVLTCNKHSQNGTRYKLWAAMISYAKLVMLAD